MVKFMNAVGAMTLAVACFGQLFFSSNPIVAD